MGDLTYLLTIIGLFLLILLILKGVDRL